MRLRSVFREILLTPALCALVLPISFLALLDWSLSVGPSSKGQPYETWEVANRSFRIRVTAYHEVGGNPFLPGAYIGYEAAPIGINEWREFLQFHANDTIRISRDSVRFVTHDVGYVLSPSKYVATLDGGRHWFDWKPLTLSSTDERLHWVIRDAAIDRDGSGVIHLYGYDVNVKEGQHLDLHTRDFGRSWSEVK